MGLRSINIMAQCPPAGHYTAVLHSAGECWNAQMLDSTGLEHVSTNMYVIFLTSISADQAVAVTSGTEPVLHIAEGATQGPYLAEADLNLVATQMFLHRIQLEALAEGLETIQTALTRLPDRFTILEDRLAVARKTWHNKCPTPMIPE